MFENETKDLAHFGEGKLAYIKAITGKDLLSLVPDAPFMPATVRLFALLSADGSPIMITDSRDVALANAREQDLETVSLH